MEQSQEPESQPESQPQEQQPQDEKQEFKLKPEEEEAILPPPKVGLDENFNDLEQIDFEHQQNIINILKNEKNLKKKRTLSKTGEEILAEIKNDPNKVGWKTRPREWDWRQRKDLGLGKGVQNLVTDFKFSGWRFLF